VDAIRQAPLTERNPDRLQTLMKAMAPDENVYVPADTVREFMQKLAPVEQEQFAAATGISDQLKTATPDSDIVFPADVYLAKVAPTDAHDAFKADLRLSPDGMSESEAKDFETHYADFIAEKGDAIAKTAQAEQAAADPGNRVFADVLEQARQAGYADDAAKRYAALYAARYETRSDRMGTDAWSEYQAAGTGSGVAVKQELPPELQARFDRLDAVIDDVRKGAAKAPNQGPSLLDFVSRNGGLKDEGGELSRIDAQDWHKAKPFRSRLVREDGLDHEGMAEKAFDAGYFPDLPQAPSGADFVLHVASEIAGRPRFAGKVDQKAVDHASAVDQLGQLLHEIGVDPAKASNTEIKTALKGYGEAKGRTFNQDAKGSISFDHGPALIKLFRGRALRQFEIRPA
jgi:hypothetical protein